MNGHHDCAYRWQIQRVFWTHSSDLAAERESDLSRWFPVSPAIRSEPPDACPQGGGPWLLARFQEIPEHLPDCRARCRWCQGAALVGHMEFKCMRFILVVRREGLIQQHPSGSREERGSSMYVLC